MKHRRANGEVGSDIKKAAGGASGFQVPGALGHAGGAGTTNAMRASPVSFMKLRPLPGFHRCRVGKVGTGVTARGAQSFTSASNG